MTDISLSPHGAAAAKAQSNSFFRHARYVVAENPVTGVAFGLFILIALCALIGPYVVPYDPLASDTSATLASPSFKHWFGTDQLGRDIFSRVIVATRLDFTIAISSVMLVFAMGGFAGIAAGFFGGWTDRIVGRISDTIMAFPLFVLAMGIVAALGNTVTNIVLATAIVNFPLYVRVARAEANAGSAAVRQRRFPHPVDAHPAQHHADHDGADLTHHGLCNPQRRGSLFHRPRRATADA
jgi:peptide/nickel transport system permease protein